MKLRRSVRLGLEQLEERCTPAINAVLDSTGMLRISGTLDNPSGTLAVIASAPGTFTVSDGVPTFSSPTISGVNSISITLGARAIPNFVYVDFYDSVGMAGPGLLNGNLTIDTGSNFADTVIINNSNGPDGAIEIGGSVQIRNAESVTFTSVDALGNVTITNSGTLVTTFASFAASTITGNVSVTGGYGIDTVGLNGDVSIGGNLNVNLGTSIFAISNDQFTMTATDTVNGFLTVSSGNGVGTTVSLAGTVNKSATISMGNGTNQFDFFNTASVLGALTVTSGNGSFNDGMGAGFAGTVGGNLVVSLGSGSNTVLLDGIFLGQSVTVVARTGINSVELGTNLQIPNGRLLVYLTPGGVNTFINNSTGTFPITLYS